jgi:RNA polymerase sigma factor (TIGR02999 family)
MRQILVDYARKQRAAKRGGKGDEAAFDERLYIAEGKAEEVIALDEALEKLAVLDPRQSKVVELRYFVGFTIPETAEALGISPATVKRDWTAARAWLHLTIANV